MKEYFSLWKKTVKILEDDRMWVELKTPEKVERLRALFFQITIFQMIVNMGFVILIFILTREITDIVSATKAIISYMGL